MTLSMIILISIKALKVLTIFGFGDLRAALKMGAEKARFGIVRGGSI